MIQVCLIRPPQWWHHWKSQWQFPYSVLTASDRTSTISYILKSSFNFWKICRWDFKATPRWEMICLVDHPMVALKNLILLCLWSVHGTISMSVIWKEKPWLQIPAVGGDKIARLHTSKNKGDCTTFVTSSVKLINNDEPREEGRSTFYIDPAEYDCSSNHPHSQENRCATEDSDNQSTDTYNSTVIKPIANPAMALCR